MTDPLLNIRPDGKKGILIGLPQMDGSFQKNGRKTPGTVQKRYVKGTVPWPWHEALPGMSCLLAGTDVVSF